MTIYITETQAIFINETLIDMYSPNEQRGVKDTGLLQSAIYRPQQTVAQEDAYPTIFHKATALFESLAKNHAFYNANKRTALACLEMFLLYNEYELKISEQEAQASLLDYHFQSKLCPTPYKNINPPTPSPRGFPRR
uniref:type II toxin-antitoxin system death-on-curing family toxin n=1 Tax=Bacillus thuringiensis TaxID=1428 RepID=UPI0021AF1A6F|nr:type II toxin-antitoxin system death-on-curing family toxin [Bacillus thuringiensis]